MEFRIFNGDLLIAVVPTRGEAEDRLDELCAMDPADCEDYYCLVTGEDD